MAKRITSARAAISEAYSMFCRSPGEDPNAGFKSLLRAQGSILTRVVGVDTKGRKDPADFIAWAVMFAGHVISVVERQEAHVAHWLKFAYSDMFLPIDEANVVKGLWRDFKDTSDLNQRQHEVLKHLVFLAVKDYRYKANTGQKKYTANELAKLVNESIFANVLSKAKEMTKDEKQAERLARQAIARKKWRIDPANWHRDFLPHFAKMQTILDTYDRNGLGPVAAELKRIEKVFDTMTQKRHDFPRFGELPLEQVQKIRDSF